MATSIADFLRGQLLDRRHKLEHAIQQPDGSTCVQILLEEIDSALARIQEGSYGICESCHDPIECCRLVADPLVRFCLDHLSRRERDALERDLQLAAQVQRGLLPGRDLDRDGWHICYYYEPAGVVSGDYCDVIDGGKAGLYFMVGDVSGKGGSRLHVDGAFARHVPLPDLSRPVAPTHARACQPRVLREHAAGSIRHAGQRPRAAGQSSSAMPGIPLR